MTQAIDPIPVVAHWPYVRRNLNLHRARVAARALDLLAELQADACGASVRLGRARLIETGLTPGEAGAVYNALVDLERRRVVVRDRATGRRADAWSFHPGIRHWRAMPWTGAGKSVEIAITSCACSTFRAVAARNPGQGVAQLHLMPSFWLSVDDHLRPPGLFPVDSRGDGIFRAATARRPGETPVDSRGYGASPSAPLLFTEEESSSLLPLEEEDERIKTLRKVLPGLAWGKPANELVALAMRLTVDQSRAVAGMLERYLANSHARPGVPQAVGLLHQFAAAPSVRAMA